MGIPSLELLIGGVGLLLLGMSMLTDGLKLAAGGALHQLLERSTQTRFRGLVTGFTFTALVQSSSAVTVATLGFTNAGLLSLEQAAWLVLGSNVGTTITGWLVSFIGLELKIDAVALPLIGLGVFLRIVRPKTRLGAAGGVISGLGLFFLGLSFLKSAFADVSGSFTEVAVADVGMMGVVYAVLIGAAMTAVLQSSSAAIAMTITAYAQGVVGDTIGAALVIGANIGTTSTAILAAIGATANAKRLAVLHVLFNVQTAVIAGMLLIPLLWLIHAARDLLGLTGDSASTLALFHTLFNILGVLLMLPLTHLATSWLSKKFVAQGLLPALPMYLDESALAVPETGALVAEKELRRVEGQISSATLDLASEVALDRVKDKLDGIRALLDAIASFIARLNTASMNESTGQMVVARLEVQVQFHAALQALAEMAGLLETGIARGFPRPTTTLKSLSSLVLPFGKATSVSERKHRAKTMLRTLKQSQRETILRASSDGRIDLNEANHNLQLIAAANHFSGEWLKATNNLEKLQRTNKQDVPVVA